MWEWVIAGLFAVILLWIAITFNRLVRWRNRVDAAWAHIDVELHRRHDLVPGLIGAVSGYLDHERSLLERVAETRAAAVAAGDVTTQAQADSALTGALRSLFAVAEGYPELRANENVLSFQEQLAHTEDRIAYARGYYNAAVAAYETLRLSVPSNLVAKASRFTLRRPFVADVSSRGAIEVDLAGPSRQ